jgi:putative glutathione S-transferase
MGVLIDGVWRDEELPQEVGRAGEFRRAESQFRNRITADGSSGFKAEPGRYHLYVAHGCPWAHRTLIYRALKKLDSLISVAYAIPGLKKNGWTFENDPRFPDCTPDTVNGFHYLYEAYTATDKRYTGKVTVPTLWDKRSNRIVNNESSEIIRILNSEFNAITSTNADYYPPPLRAEIDQLNKHIYHNSTTACTAAVSPDRRLLTMKLTTAYSRPSTSWRSVCPAGATSWAISSPRPTGDCFRL